MLLNLQRLTNNDSIYSRLMVLACAQTLGSMAEHVRTVQRSRSCLNCNKRLGGIGVRFRTEA